MHKVNVGVSGVGVLGTHHTRLYKQCQYGELIGIYDTNSEQAQKIAAQFSTKAFSSLESLAESVDCLSVAVPTHYHFKEVMTLLKLGKHILVEKPLTSTVDEGRKLLDYAKENNLILHVGHVERYNPVITYLQKKIYDPRFIETHRLAPYPPQRPGLLPRGTEVGVVLDLMIHDIDIILNLVKSEVKMIDSVGIPILSKSEDIANVRINFSNGCVANLTASRVSQEYMRKIRVFQPDAYLSLDYQEKKGEIVTKEKVSMNREQVPIEDHDALEMELGYFIKCTMDTVDSKEISGSNASAEHALKSLDIANRITKQIIST